MPAVSVLFPVYNCENTYLRKAIESMLNQSFDDFELIIFDDGSTTDVKSVIEDYLEVDPRIVYIREELHHGLAYGLNAMVALSKGKYLARMDADDISAPYRLEMEFTFLEEHPEYGFVGGNLVLIDDDDNVYGARKYPEKPDEKDFLKFQPYAHPTIMFRKSVLNMENPYGSPDRPRRGEDYELFMNLTAAGVRGYNLQENLLYYRETINSYKRRTLTDQVAEVTIRWNGFKKMGLNPWREIGYVVKPIAVWMVPDKIAFNIRNGSRA
ncbi:Glycosyltransferase involved in cell wall bisynthesis [Pseudobutyrivibrio xylanivorans]|uniref:Glycosyltransferase involved in cell wall bisynthesis n=1 Tax=Pseudobutyrivibrio xylanivorans TaxID=185007 RepID=A0A1G5S3A7_PSEXY|nr:Glycosyltransferase involved in cell wall bisynthesis [Pseudobutyrivibrio xylanivorans]